MIYGIWSKGIRYTVRSAWYEPGGFDYGVVSVVMPPERNDVSVYMVNANTVHHGACAVGRLPRA